MKTKAEQVLGVATVVISIVALMISGLSYFSVEASKRGDLTVFVNNNYVTLNDDNSTGKTYLLMTFNVEGTVSNEGPRTCQLNDFSFLVSLSIPTILQDNRTTVTKPSFSGYEKSLTGLAINSLGWQTRLFDAKERKSFSISYPIKVDPEYGNQTEFADASIKLLYSDGLGNQISEVPITGNWSYAISFTQTLIVPGNSTN